MKKSKNLILLITIFLFTSGWLFGQLNVVENGADSTGVIDCTELLQTLHNTGEKIYYPNGTYRFNGHTLNFSGGVEFESLHGVIIRNDISAQPIVNFDDFGNLIGLQQNHLELDETVLGTRGKMTDGSLVSPPLSTASPAYSADFIAHWYNNWGLDAVRTGNFHWRGWYYWSWNFHRNIASDRRDPYDPSRHSLLGFYRGDDPVVLDWQCYWFAEYGIKAVTLCTSSDGIDFDQWDQPSAKNHWIYQIFNNVPNFNKLKYIMWEPTRKYLPSTAENKVATEEAWIELIDSTYLKYDNFYTIERGGKEFPVIYSFESQALRGVFDNYNGSANTAAFLGHIADRFQAEGYGGVAIFARKPISNNMMNYANLESNGVLYLQAGYGSVYGATTYPDYAATADTDWPTDASSIINTVTSHHTQKPHPSAWVCPGQTPELFKQVLQKAVDHVQTNDMLRIVTCYANGEWAEGGPGLHPNMQDRFGYLEAISTFRDSIAPEITSAPNNQILESNAGCQAVLPDYTVSVEATDNQSSSSVLEISQAPEAGVKISGDSNEVSLKVIDEARNSTQVSFNVKVEDNEAPGITCVENQTVDPDQGQTVYTVSASEFDPVLTEDYCEFVSVTNDFNNSSTLEGAELPAGKTTIVWKVEDKAGNESYCSFDVAVNKPVGIKKLEDYGILVYPNPTQGRIYLESTNNPIQQIKISDLTGKVLIEKANIQQQKETIDLSKYGDGIYFFNIITDDNTHIIKIIYVR